MSSNPLFANFNATESEPVEAAAPATQRSVIEWSELVGFRRRFATSTKKPAPQPVEDAGEGIVVVGKGASIVGEITNCSQVEIAGALEGKIVAATVIVRPGGVLKGHVCAERAEVHGTIEGQIQIEDHLDIHATGDVSGELTYGKLSVASGGRLAGSVEIVAGTRLDDASGEARPTSVRSTTEAFAAASFV